MPKQSSTSLLAKAPSPYAFGDIAERLAVEPVAIHVSKFMAEAAAHGLTAAIAGISAVCLAPVLGYAALFGGALWLSWRKERKNEQQLRDLFGDVHQAIALVQADLSRSKTILEDIYQRRRFVWARISGSDWAEQRRAIREDLAKLLHEKGGASPAALRTLDAVLDIGSQLAEHEQAESERHALAMHVADATKSNTDLIRSDIAGLEERMVARLLAAKSQDAPADAATDRDLVAAVERLARDAARGGMTARNVLESENPSDVADYLAARRRQLDLNQTALNDLFDEKKIELDREFAAVAYTTGRIDEAAQALQRVLVLIPDDLEMLNGLGNIHLISNQLSKAKAIYRRVEKLAYGDEPLLIRTYGNLGFIMQIRGDLNGAFEMFRKALDIAELVGIAKAYGNFGSLMFRDLDCSEQTDAMPGKSLGIDAKLGHLGPIAELYPDLDALLRTHVDLKNAEALLRRTLETNEKRRWLEGWAAASGNLGVVLHIRGDLDAAEAMYCQALRIYEKLRRSAGMANQYGSLGILNQTRGDFKTARKYWTKSRDLFAKRRAKHMVDLVQGWLDELPHPE